MSVTQNEQIEILCSSCYYKINLWKTILFVNAYEKSLHLAECCRAVVSNTTGCVY